jgi:methionyl-tRNA formyltransferase
MNPEPMAWFESNGAAVRVIKARLFETPLETEALARLVGKELVVDCNGGSLVLEVVQPSGKQEMNGADWFRGLRVETLKLS